MSVAILGGGISGLSTARAVLEKEPNARVDVFASAFSPNTTGDVAAGVSRPTCEKQSDVIGWQNTTINYWKNTLYADRSHAWGVGHCPCYVFSSLAERDPVFGEGYEEVTEVFRPRRMERAEVAELGHSPSEYDGSVVFETWYLNCKQYLPLLLNDLLSTYGTSMRALTRHINRLDDVDLLKYDVIVNCTGLGSYYLVPDTTMYPVRGQVIKARAPHIKQCWWFSKNDYTTYVIPTGDEITIGGVRQKGNWSLDVSDVDTAGILERASSLCPSVPRDLSNMRVVTGLRPGRETVRLELEYRNVPIVHNYGHTGSGVLLSRGCALDAADLVKRALHGGKESRAKL